MSEAASHQLIERVAEILRNTPGLSGWEILSDWPADIAVEPDSQPVMVVSAVAIRHQIDEMQGQYEHTATFEVAAASGPETYGSLTGSNLTALALVAGALLSDITLGGIAQDTVAIDTAAAASGKDVAANSLQFRSTFYTPTADWTAFAF